MTVGSLLRPVAAAAALLVALSGCSDADGGDTATQDAAAPRASQTSQPSPVPADLPRGKGFDFYVLALSWSPSYCLGADAGGGGQCASGRELGFVVHGLWPQFEHGYPQYCASALSERVTEAAGAPMLDLVPSMGLLGHMWRKHGLCAGLSQQDFFRVTRAARARIAIPQVFADSPRNLSSTAAESAFVDANPGMSRTGIAAVCKGGRLQEVRICLTHALEFRACREVDAAGCQAGSLAVPPPR
ncbi:ribonuclease T2 family protein [Hoeflea marina]|uniref:ribonuclease T2 family protein n=1 Tax=Hoeflea marina TaxID=274592 RepID=UPI001FE05C4C|nr:ribonuclease [Hoeflea marina]